MAATITPGSVSTGSTLFPGSMGPPPVPIVKFVNPLAVGTGSLVLVPGIQFGRTLKPTEVTTASSVLVPEIRFERVERREDVRLNVTQFLEECRDLLDDPQKLSWTDLELVRHGNRVMRQMFRRQADLDEDYHNAEVRLLKSEAINVRQNVWHYPLRSWAYKILRVRLRTEGDDGEGELLQQANDREDQDGWKLAAHYALELRGHSEAQDLDVRVAKLPGRVTRGKMSRAGVSAAKFYLPNEDVLKFDFPLEAEEGAYVNSLFHFTGVDSISHKISNTVARCSASAHLVTVGGFVLTEITLERNLLSTPAVDDTFETIFEVHDAHTALLIMLSCRQALTKKGNSHVIRELQQRIDPEMLAFIAHIQPRRLQEPAFQRTSTSRTLSRNFSLDEERSYFGY